MLRGTALFSPHSKLEVLLKCIINAFKLPGLNRLWTMSQCCINWGITPDAGRGADNYVACLKAIDFIKQFDLNRGKKSLISQPVPSLGKLCRAGSSTGLCCISEQQNETITGPAVTPWHRKKVQPWFHHGERKWDWRKLSYRNVHLYILLVTTFCHYSLILNNIYRDEESGLLQAKLQGNPHTL